MKMSNLHYISLRKRYAKCRRRLARTLLRIGRGARERRKALILYKHLKRLALALNPWRKPALAAVVSGIMLTSASMVLRAQTPTIATLTPAANAIDVASTSNISITFSTTMNVSTLTAAHIRIYGSQTGLLSTRGSFSGNPARAFDPDSDFKPGEEIMVTVTGATSQGGSAIAQPRVYSFLAAAQGGTGAFSSSAFDGGASTDVAVGDLDGDGDLDAVIANVAAVNRIWLNNGDGTFSSSAFDIARLSEAVVLGDLDGDGDLDMMVGNGNSVQQDQVWLNNGDATFTSYSVGNANSLGIALGDLDGDGDLDAVVADLGGAQEVRLNNGDGTFSTFTFGGGSSLDVALGDLDGDGDLDAVVANFSPGQEIWLNNGDASFTSSTFGGGDGRGVALGDLDGDGDLDAVIANRNSKAQEIWVNNGDATFTSSSFGSGNSRGVAFGDLDGDGDLDAVVANYSGNTQEIWINKGDATFASSAFDAGNGRDLALGDLDGDGALDIIIVKMNQPQSIWLNKTFKISALDPAARAAAAPRDTDVEVTFNESADIATLTTATVPNNGNLVLHGMQTGHISTLATLSYHDGNTRVAIDPAADFKPGEKIMMTIRGAQNTDGEELTPTVYGFRAAVQGGAADFSSTAFGSGSSRDVAVGDLDGDGDLDAIVGNLSQAQEIWLNNGDGLFTSSTFGGGNGFAIALGDLDGDGDLDAAFAGSYGAAQQIWMNNGDGSFSSSTFGGGNSLDIALGDLDGDGDLDAVVARWNTSQELWINNGDGTFTSSAIGSGKSEDVALGDLDGDGDLDVIIANNYQPQDIWLNNGDASFTSSTFGGAFFSTGVDLGDLDGDGDLDAVIATARGGAQEIWVNNGNATFSSSSFSAFGDSRGVTFGDLDGDSDLDAVITNYNGAQEIWLNNGDATFTSSAFDSGKTFGDAAIGDLDGDGDLDAIVANRDQTQSIWLNNTAPEIGPLANTVIRHNSATTVTISLTDDAIGDLIVTASSGNQSLLPDANLTLSATAASMTLTLAPECGQSGTSVITVTASDGILSTSASFTATVTTMATLAVNGSTCACFDAEARYTAEPAEPGASYIWAAQGGSITGGQGTGTVLVQWDPGTTASLSVVRTSLAGCTTAGLLSIDLKTVQAVMDYGVVTTSAGVTLAVLSNDTESSLLLSAVEDPRGGSASISGDIVTYVPDAGFTGLDTFTYRATNANGCAVTGAIVVAVPELEEHKVNIEFIERAKDRVAGVRGIKHAVATALSPDGRYLYVAGRREHSIAIFGRDSSTGTLSYTGRVRNNAGGVSGLKFPYSVTLSPNGRYLYAAGFGQNSVVAFRRDAETGALTFLEKKRHGQNDGGVIVRGIVRPRSLTVSPDGAHLYVAGFGWHTLAAFRRDTATGRLTWQERHKDGFDGVDGLRRARDVTVSPDGRHVYVCGFADKAVAVFSRDLTDGALTFVERRRDGILGVDGLAGASAAAVSPDGRHVYVAGKTDRAVAVFRRASGTGKLTYVARYKDGIGGVDGLAGACDVAVSPDGRHVWVAGLLDDAVALFERDAATGKLTWLQRIRDNTDGADGLNDVQALAVDPTSRHVYGASFRDNAVAVMFRNRFPVALNDAAGSVATSATLSVSPLFNDSDADSHALTITGVTGASLGAAVITGGGAAIDYTAGATPGADTFTYTIADGHGGTSTATVNVSVTLAKSGVSASLDPRSVLESQNSQSGWLSAVEISPNPAVAMVDIAFTLSEASLVQLRLVSLSGAVVSELMKQSLTPGAYTLALDTRRPDLLLPAGTYIVEISARDARGRVVRDSEALVIVR